MELVESWKTAYPIFSVWGAEVWQQFGEPPKMCEQLWGTTGLVWTLLSSPQNTPQNSQKVPFLSQYYFLCPANIMCMQDSCYSHTDSLSHFRLQVHALKMSLNFTSLDLTNEGGYQRIPKFLDSNKSCWVFRGSWRNSRTKLLFSKLARKCVLDWSIESLVNDRPPPPACMEPFWHGMAWQWMGL